MGSGRGVRGGTSSFWILTFPLTLAACATGRDLQPAATIPELDALQVGQAVATSAAPGKLQPTDWWRVYRDPQLDRLVDTALQDAPTIAIASARIAQANAALGSAKADTRPTVTGSGNALGEYFPDHYIYSSAYAGDLGSQGDITADARYHLDFWGRYRNAAAASSARVEAARAEARDAALLLQTALVESYVRLDAACRLRDVAASGLQRRQGVVDLVTLRTGAGLATDIDAVQAREAITSTRSEIARLDAEIARRRNEIAALLGKGPGYGDMLVRPALTLVDDPTPSSAIPASLLGYRPDVTAQRARVEAAAKEIGVARAAFYPDVDLRAFAGLASIGLGQLVRSGSAAAGVGPAVTLPIFDGGALRSALRARNAEFDEAVANYEATIATALQQVADGIVTLRSERERLAQADEAIAHWNRVVALQRIREKQGLSSSMERLSAETALLLSERDEGEARVRVAVAQVSLIRALGGAWTSHDQ
jgi:NodT family efflux transporter outer membrane factor (OMF) lipoprotein